MELQDRPEIKSVNDFRITRSSFEGVPLKFERFKDKNHKIIDIEPDIVYKNRHPPSLLERSRKSLQEVSNMKRFEADNAFLVKRRIIKRKNLKSSLIVSKISK